MFNQHPQLWLIPGLPFFAALITGFFGPRLLRKQSHWPCILAVIGSFILSFFVAGTVRGLPEGTILQKDYYPWFRIGEADIGFALRADGLTVAMLLTVTFVGSLIAIFSVGYMSHEREHEAGYARFFAAFALFVASMTGLVMADNFMVLFTFWEGVGLCSYLLIGFWYEKPFAAAAARKAFLVNRIGDVGFILGILLLWIGFAQPTPERLRAVDAGGYALDYNTIFAAAPTVMNEFAGGYGHTLLVAICLLLFCGAVGKSAQFPLYVWLPDAMEGPTPVSALIHAATMVTAGVYLVARCMPLFHLVPEVLAVVASIGAFTALLAALIALTQTDLKRVLAYSTVSQLGYMFLALGSGTTEGVVLIAVTAAMFHLITHAFFKALLFLSAGSVMHSMGGIIDMRRFSGLKAIMPVTHITFLCGAGALAGIPLLSGFWSKDDILGVALHASGHGPYRNLYLVLFISGLVTAGLTAFYTFRAYFLTFHGELKVPTEAGHHAHESPSVMTAPLCILAVGAVFLGIILEPFTHWLSGFLEVHWQVPLLPEPAKHTHNIGLMLGSSLFAIGGVAVAWWMYVRQPGFADGLVKNMQALYQASLNKFYVDEIYNALVVEPMNRLADFGRAFDTHIIDNLVDLIAHLPSLVGAWLRPIQNGLLQYYALVMSLGLVIFIGVLVMMRATW